MTLRNKVRKALQDPRAATTHLVELVDRRPEPETKRASDAGDYWSSSQVTEAVRELSHWRGEGHWDAAEWDGIGTRHVDLFSRLALTLGNPVTPTRMLEWGPGGGSNVLAFSKQYNLAAYFGVDISQANIDECARQAHAAGVTGFVPLKIDPVRPDAVRSAVSEPIDAFLSTAVYQHFPSKAYGVTVTRLAAELLRPGGLALVQTRYPDGSRRFAPKSRRYKHNAITFTSYGVHEFWNLLADAGLRPMAIHLSPAVNYAFYLAVKAS